MLKKVNWTQILVQCKDNVHKRMRPLLKTLAQPQPDLGTGAGGDPKRRIDLVAEKAIIDTLKERKIAFTLISEESGTIEYSERAGPCYVTVDPIDGTTNLMRGIPFYATSIAVSQEPYVDKVHTGLVADLLHGTTYTAQKGQGAYRGRCRIAPSKNTSLEEAVIGVDLNSYKIQKLVPRLSALLGETKHIRHFGANALEMCYVADGTTDAFVDIRGKLRTTDMAAARLIIEEAGALITTPEGNPLNVKLDPTQKVEFIAAANKEIHKKILDLTNQRKVT